MYLSQKNVGLISEKPKPPWVGNVEIPADTETKATRGVLNLFQDTQHNLEEKIVYHRGVLKLLSTIGVQENSKIDFFLNPAYQRIEIHHLELIRNGQVFNLLPDQEVQTFDLELEADNHVFSGRLRVLLLLKDTRVGDIIDFSCSIVELESPYRPLSSGRFLIHGPGEALKISAKLLYKAERKVFASPINLSIEPSVEYGPTGLVECKWEVLNPPVIEAEYGTPVWHNPYSWIDYGEYASWADVVSWECKAFATPEKLPGELEALVHRYRSESKNDEAFILKALTFVQNEIRYVSVSVGEHAWRPHTLEAVLARRYGDCKDKSLMLHALLNAAGIPSKIALVHTDRKNSITSWLPGPHLFNHVIVQTTHNQLDYWLDSTLQGERGLLTRRPCPDFGKALLISPETTGLTDIVPNYRGHQNRIRVTETFKSSKTFAPVELTVTRIYEGGPANSMRLKFGNSSDAELVRFFTNEYSGSYPGIKCIGLPKYQENEVTNSITITLSFSLTEFWKPLAINPAYVGVRLHLSTIKGILRLPDSLLRKSPLSVVHPIHLSHIVILRITKPFQNSKKNATFKSSAFECKIKSEASSTYFELSADYESKDDHVLPANLKAHTEACHSLSNALEEVFYVPKD